MKAEMKTKSGPKPDMKIRTVDQPSASAERAAPVAINGANAHNPHVTRLGFDFPRNMSRIYTNAPVKPRITDTSTSQ